MTKLPVSSLSLAILFTIPSSAFALSGEEILQKVDQVEFSSKDASATTKMELEDRDGTKSYRKVKMFQKGEVKRLIRFLEPADVRGLSFLCEDDDTMYLFLPAMNKIRRIAGHVKNDNFAGTDYAFEDLEAKRFAPRFLAKTVEEKPEHYVLELAVKPDSESQYSLLRMEVRKQDFAFEKITFFDKSGREQKVLLRKDFRKQGAYIASYWMEVTDLKSQHKTRNLVESIEYDTGLEDRFFSKRQLKRQ